MNLAAASPLRLRLRLLFAVSGAAVLTLLYVNTFVIWAMVQARLGTQAHWVPLGLAVLLLLLFFLSWLFHQPRRFAAGAGLLALVAAGVGFGLADPDFPAKRIHVPQYALLAGLLYWGWGGWLAGHARLFAAVAMAGFFGVHDELIQGLHAQRSYGLMDMVVNAFGALAGGLLCRALFPVAHSTAWPPLRDWAWLALVFISLLAMLIILQAYQSMTLPLWLPLPLVGAGLYWLSLRPGHNHSWRVPMDMMAALMVLCSLYIYGARLAHWPFH